MVDMIYDMMRGEKSHYLQEFILSIERDTCVLKKDWPPHDNVF